MLAGYHSDTIGYGVLDIPKTNRSWILLEWKVKVLNRPKYGDILEAKTWARNCTKIFTYRDFEIYNQNNEKCVLATSKWTWVDAKTGKMARIDSDIDEKYGAEKMHVFDCEDIEKVEEPDNFLSEVEYIVKRRDIDINNHMHNLYYLDVAEEALPEEIYFKRPFNNFRITYKRGIKLGETVNCKYGIKENKQIVKIEDNTGKEKAIISMWD